MDAITWPAQGNDCLAAVDYVHNHASEFGIDRERMACWGGSAGGHLCAYTATFGPYSKDYNATLLAAVSYYPPTNILKLFSDVDPRVGIDRPVLQADSFESLLLGSAKTGISLGEIILHENSSQNPWNLLANLAKSVDPEMYITDKTPQMLVAHGTLDHTVPYKQSVRLVSSLAKANRPHEFVTAEGCDHASEPRECWVPTLIATAEWLAKVLA